MNRNEPFINTELLEMVMQAKQISIEEVQIDDHELERARHLSELYRIVKNYDEDEMIVCVAAVLEKNSTIIHQVMETERRSYRKGKKKNDGDNS